MPIPRKAYQTSGTLNPPPFPLPLDRPPTLIPEYKCYQCGRDDWKNSSALARHEQSHNGDNEKAHHCTECGKSFSQKTALTTHMNIHTGRRPHMCRSGCSNTFSDPSSRTRHEKELHDPGHGWKCLVLGCNEICKRKQAYRQHMENAHGCNNNSLTDNDYNAAKEKCAKDYAEQRRKGLLNMEIGEDDFDFIDENDSDEVKPLTNGKRRRSGSASSDDHLGPPPAKKQALGLGPSRRNAVGIIEIPTPHSFTPSLVGHKHGDSDELSASTASSYIETFSGAYQPTGHMFINGSPSSQPLNSAQDYQKAVDRVASPAYVPQGASTHVLLYPEASGYSVALDGNNSRASVTMPEPHNYQYSHLGVESPARPRWTEHGSPYGSQWPLGNEVAQTPHGTVPVAPEGPSTRGALASSRSGLLHSTNNSGVHLSAGEQQIEHPSGSPNLGPRLGHISGPFGDHQALMRTSGGHNHSPHLDSPHMSMGMYTLEQPTYPSYPQQMPRIMPSGSNQDRSYS